MANRGFDLPAIALTVTTWIALSPYYAGWVNHAHWWIYAILGTLNSLFFMWLFTEIIYGTRTSADERGEKQISALIRVNPRPIILLSLGLFVGSAGAALLQPLTPNNGSPIRAPIIAPGMEIPAAFAFAALLAMVVIAIIVSARVMRAQARPTSVAIGIALVFAPLFFAVFTLTKESTAIFESTLRFWGG